MAKEYKLFYKFRNLESVFEHKELENQEIYFALPNELNDPMDCQPKIVFEGDSIVWLNLLRHFLINLIRNALVLDCIEKPVISFSRQYFDMNNIFSLNHNNNFNKLYNNIYSYLEKDLENISNMLSKFNKPIPKDFVVIIFFKIMVLYIYVLDTYIHKNELHKNKYDNYINNIIDTINILKNMNKEECNFQNFKREFSDVLLYYSHDNSDMKYFILDFLMKYINRLEELLFPDVRISAFSEIYNNTLMWSHYADDHKGICLIFNSIQRNNEYFFNMYLYNRTKPTIYIFKQINYSIEKNNINFFEHIFMTHLDEFKKYWYYHPTNNKKSKYYHDYSLSDSQNMLNFADNFLNSYYIKSTEWEYEKEYRLFILPEDSTDRTIRYDFSSLNGIIFGIKTPLKDKLKIIDIIKEKCKKENRENFNFYQAYYNADENKIDTYLIDDKLFMEHK